MFPRPHRLLLPAWSCESFVCTQPLSEMSRRQADGDGSLPSTLPCISGRSPCRGEMAAQLQCGSWLTLTACLCARHDRAPPSSCPALCDPSSLRHRDPGSADKNCPAHAQKREPAQGHTGSEWVTGTWPQWLCSRRHTSVSKCSDSDVHVASWGLRPRMVQVRRRRGLGEGEVSPTLGDSTEGTPETATGAVSLSLSVAGAGRDG